MLNKKAVAVNVLVITITSLLFLIIVGTVIKNIDTNLEEKELEILCEQTVSYRATTAIQINEDEGSAKSKFKLIQATLKGSPVLCQTIDKKIKGDREEILEQVSDKMAKCWWMFGEGNYEEILHGSSVDVLPFIFGTDEYQNGCFDCYNIIIDQDNIKGGDITSEELMDFVSTETYSNSNMTYLEYIQSYGGPGRLVLMAPEGIKADNVYTISMAPKNKEIDESAIWKGVGKIAGGIVGAVILGAVTGGVGWIVVGGVLVATGVTYTGWNDIKAALMSEREVSSIYFTHLNTGDNFCGTGYVDTSEAQP